MPRNTPSESDRPSPGADGPLEEDEALRRMYRLTADHERGFDEKVRDLLDLGRSHLGVEAGFLTEIGDGTQLIVQARGDHELLQSGESCPLSKSYCRRTIRRENALTVQHAAVEGWEDDAAYEVFGLESYIGAKVMVDGDLYGTFCFADSTPREEPFADSEEVFVELMADWAGYELFRRRATERIEAQCAQLEEFTKVVSHDLRNPLNVAQGHLDMAEKTGEASHFEDCRSSLNRMESLIDDLLVVARQDDGTTETETIELTEFVRECWSFVSNDGATLVVEADVSIEGNDSRLREMFGNLFRNAIEHGRSDVTIRVGQLDEGEGLYVEDDGSGIPPEDRDRVFDDGYTTNERGTGFGLTIVKQISDAHGWNVEVTDGSDGGARFEFGDVTFTDR